MSEFVIHTSASRGTTNKGWMHSKHTFSFADYYHAERIFFGALRVLNETVIAPNRILTHQIRSNVEIITIPLSGELTHYNHFHKTEIKTGDVELISAGKGVMFNSCNNSNTDIVRYLQLWIFPKQKNTDPYFEYCTFPKEERKNKLQLIISPEKDENILHISQNAWIYLSEITQDSTLQHKLNTRENGVYIFVLSGAVEINNNILTACDGIGLWDTKEVIINSKENTELLLIELPVKI